eukprot:CAMPEP_0197174808 /NCGR_PEP_ID=MMETSP1423-20130617/1193_1 /TAXON_ID=476441 /ORGANISM="Pseudo-nitzschia heimii, Strain UNC1101" /LENGTH=190 /DNA_ID=CAMNT_0042623795 /DNA_START=59 /DNA_END=631 /DNA_ORIENTATION=+
MAPLIEYSDVSMSCSEDDIYRGKPIITAEPLHFHEESRERSRKRVVSFGAVVTTREVLSRYDYTIHELENTFLGSDDMKRMKETARSEGRLLQEDRLLCPETNSPRGLEHRTREGSKRKRQSRVNAYAAVFFEVDYQQQECFDDADAIADAYYTYSQPCAVRAREMAKRDEVEAMRIYEEETSPGFWSSL